MFVSYQQAIDWLLSFSGNQSASAEQRLAQTRQIIQAAQLTPTCPIITITGTNGKGSCLHLLKNILSHAGYRVGCFTSPHVQRFNERIAINDTLISDQQLLTAAQHIAAWPQALPEHFFSLLLLIALHFFQQHPIDVLLLEVGIGGRLDACNALDADILAITSVALDHQQLLGHDREQIGREKAGLMRAGQLALSGDERTPLSVVQHSQHTGTVLYRFQNDFVAWPSDCQHFHWQGQQWLLTDLPKPVGVINNFAVALAIVEALQARLPVPLTAIHQALQSFALKGRYQSLSVGKTPMVLDVAHNPAAIERLIEQLRHDWPQRPLQVVFGMMDDKAWRQCLTLLRQLSPVACYFASLLEARSAAPDTLVAYGQSQGLKCHAYHSPIEALTAAMNAADETDLIVVTGSFRLVGAVLDYLSH